jgi:deoxyribodipyrimidine photo-lyase
MRRLYWRGHFIQKLETEPSIEFRAFHAAHEAHRTPTDADHPSLEAWVAGRTGFPFLDACMRSLTATGWLNFRMRAMVQSFASYHLGLDWRVSGQRLARLFTDYEPGIHWSQVQMQSGQTGINVPRIYNPVKQGLEQDPNGTFTRRWVPELAAVSDGYLQMPWLAGTASLDYPDRIVDHEEAARLAKERLTAIRSTSRYRETAQDVFVRHGSRLRRSDAVEASIKSRNRRQKDPESAPQLPLL